MPQLDALRAFAVAAVFVHHFLPSRLLPWPLDTLPLGFLGVRLFFVLSGFLITGILLRARTEIDLAAAAPWRTLGVFYARRFLRIFPLYYFVLAACALLAISPVRQELPWLATYTFNFRIAYLGWYPENIAHFWSLAVEEQFYLFWPFAALFAPRRSLLPVTVAMVICGVAFRALALPLELNPVAAYVATPSSLDALGIGSALALASRGDVPTRALVAVLARTALPAGLAVAASLVWMDASLSFGAYLHQAFFDTAAACVFCWLVAATAHGFAGWRGRLLACRPLRYCGRIAYGLYVYHLLLADPLDRVLRPLQLSDAVLGWSKLGLGTAATFVVAALSWELMERPINALKNKFPYASPSEGQTGWASENAPRPRQP